MNLSPGEIWNTNCFGWTSLPWAAAVAQRLARRTCENARSQLQSIEERLADFEQDPSWAGTAASSPATTTQFHRCVCCRIPLARAVFRVVAAPETSAALNQLGAMQKAISPMQLQRAAKSLEQLEDGKLEEFQLLRHVSVVINRGRFGTIRSGWLN